MKSEGSSAAQHMGGLSRRSLRRRELLVIAKPLLPLVWNAPGNIGKTQDPVLLPVGLYVEGKGLRWGVVAENSSRRDPIAIPTCGRLSAPSSAPRTSSVHYDLDWFTAFGAVTTPAADANSRC